MEEIKEKVKRHFALQFGVEWAEEPSEILHS
jgi:hypothetical protein